MASTIIEQQRRAFKTSALVERLQEAGATAATIAYLDDDDWTHAAQATGVRTPSPATRAFVTGWFDAREQRPADSFAGIDDAAEAAP